jgi:hypothetical protein
MYLVGMFGSQTEHIINCISGKYVKRMRDIFPIVAAAYFMRVDGLL